MAERSRARLDEAEAGRPERARFDAPAGSVSGPLVFPWASALSIGWGPSPRVPSPRPVAPARKRKPAAE